MQKRSRFPDLVGNSLHYTLLVTIMGKNAWYSLLLLSCLFGLTFCGKPKEPDYIDFRNLKLKKAALDQAVITFDLRYFNPNKFAVQLRKAEVDIYFNDKFLGHSVLDTTINVPKRDTFAVPVSMQVKLKDAFSNAVQLLLNPNVMVKLKGNARVSKGAISMNVPINYEGMKRIDLLGRDSTTLK